MTDPLDNDASASLRRASHDINNLLAVMQGHADALSRSLPPSDPQRKHVDSLLETLQRSDVVARRLAALIHGRDPGELIPAVRPASEVLSGTETVLLVDDEEALRGVTARFLGMNGYKVLEAGGMEEGMSIETGLGRLDILVTDMLMSGGNGPELARALRARRPELKVLFLSGQNPDEMRRQVGDGVRDSHFLAKPFRPKDLILRIREILDADHAAPR